MPNVEPVTPEGNPSQVCIGLSVRDERQANFSIGEKQYKENNYNDDANRYYSCAARLVFLSSGVSRPGPIPENSNGEYGERGWGGGSWRGHVESHMPIGWAAVRKGINCMVPAGGSSEIRFV